jgi:uncharacterized protein (DUF2062 family)
VPTKKPVAKKVDDPTAASYERLGRAVEATLVKNYIEFLHSTRRQIWSAFVRGVFMGLGSVIGATLVVALLLAILQLLGGTPLIGQYLKPIGDILNHR